MEISRIQAFNRNAQMTKAPVQRFKGDTKAGHQFNFNSEGYLVGIDFTKYTSNPEGNSNAEIVHEVSRSEENGSFFVYLKKLLKNNAYVPAIEATDKAFPEGKFNPEKANSIIKEAENLSIKREEEKAAKKAAVKNSETESLTAKETPEEAAARKLKNITIEMERTSGKTDSEIAKNLLKEILVKLENEDISMTSKKNYIEQTLKEVTSYNKNEFNVVEKALKAGLNLLSEKNVADLLEQEISTLKKTVIEAAKKI